MKLQVKKYSYEFRDEWDNFIDKAKNSTFLFKRNFIEYHGLKFIDFSLLVFDNKKLVAVLPANLENGKTVVSHSGLTYGGIVMLIDTKLNLYLIIFKHLLLYLKDRNILLFKYKAIPIFYSKLPTQEEEYALFLLKANVYRIDTTLTIKNNNIFPFQNRRRRRIKKANKNSVAIKEDNNFELFWRNVLIPHLAKKHNKIPTHSLNEIKYLANKFPNNIKQVNVYLNDEIVAGSTMFETKNVAHSQYIASTSIGRNVGALDKLFQYLILTKYIKKEFFDFGICNENNGKSINHGLLDWKEGFGGRTFVHKHYAINTLNYTLLNEIRKVKKQKHD